MPRSRSWILNEYILDLIVKLIILKDCINIYIIGMIIVLFIKANFRKFNMLYYCYLN